MKSIKLLLVFAIISIIAVSCKETKKEEMNDASEAVEVIDESADTSQENSEVVSESAASDTEEGAEVEKKSPEESIVGATHDVESLEVDDNIMVEAMADTPVVYPGCEGSAEEIRACSIGKFKKFLKDNIDPDLARNLNLSPGTHPIRSLVRIDTDGVVSVLKVQAKQEGLEKEMLRIFKKFPKMTPASKDGKPVSVSFIVPIDYEVRD
ncbi:MAG: energy transducer TonB [Flavobacteriaceae bacterium]|nr:energy transducer TonB [Flavobacteriaceae bacterium]